jgi:hypothetical protein
MTTSRKTTEGSTPSRKPAGKRGQSAADLQPAATGANRGSPAAPVMKQFQKTKTESSGRS